jgi:isopenicillin-N epimerase
VPFPLQDPQQVVDAVMAAITPRTRLFLLDHVTSPTGVVLPVETLVPWMESRGIAVLVDGAHAPGMVPLNLNELGASYYTGNCHKWLCTPKGSAFLHVRRDLQANFRPLVISHGANAMRTDRSRFRLEFDWTGTMDPTPFLVIPDALQFLASLQTGGIAGHMRIIRERALQGRHILTQALNIDMPAPDSMIGTLAAFPLPDDPGDPSDHPLYLSQLQLQLKREFGIQIPIIPWPRHPRRLVRFAVQRYNSLDQLIYLAHALKAVC